MGARRHDPEERKILKFYKGFRGWVGVEVAPAQGLGVFARGLFGPARQHDPCALQGIASDALVQHQGDPVVGKDIPGMQRQPRDQQDRRAIGVACDIHQRAVGIAAPRHQGRQSPLAASPQQRPGQPAGIEINGGLHQSPRYIPLQKGPFFG